ncbi:AraC family transcriptional regulator [Pendulispora albinea]|uniref:AraC family transcriptional regulator n=1 Tax=Pendulispora albinea TaxID=2741071 RepID=A0ABZ2M7S3_9BACT
MFDWVRKNDGHAIEANVRSQLELPEATGTLLKEMTVPLHVYRAAGDLTAELMGDDFIGLHAAGGTPRGSFGILEFAARSAPNVDQALKRTARYWRLLSETIRLELERSPGEVALAFRIPNEPLCMGRQGNEFAAGIFHRYLNEMTQVGLHATRVEFAHAPPRETGALAEFFGTTNLQFECGRNRIAFDESILALPIPASDERLLPWLDGYADSLLPPESVAAQAVPGLHRQIRHCLQDGRSPTVAEVARRLRVSSRTLQRRLGEVSMSFYRVLEEIRHELAESYLRDPRLSIYEIALRLGYANERGFERAFMKWHGTTPRAYRRQLPAFQSRTRSSQPPAECVQAAG